MESSSDSNKRIFKNAMMLYFRMFILMGVSLYTVRLLLKELGVVDYGIYNVVGGIIIFFTFLNTAVAQSTQRYLSFYLGKDDAQKLRDVFSMSVNIFLLMLAVVFIIAETVGLWFLNTRLNFPEGRVLEINITYQVTIVTFFFQFLQIPYRAAIIAHERMEFYAYLSFVEIFLKLGSVLVLFLFAEYKLVIYAAALLVSTVTILACYIIFCRRFEECRCRKMWDKNLFKELTGFYGWNMLEGVGLVSANQGYNMLFNIFCGVVVNAALAVCNQVHVAVTSFLTNFLVAFNPQIVKSYAAGAMEQFFTLVFRCSKFAFGLMAAICIPTMFYCGPYLELWLDEVPDCTVMFVRIMLVFVVVDALSGSLWISAQAAGRLKVYSILMSSLLLLNIPIAYLLLKMDVAPYWVLSLKVIQNVASHVTRIFYLKKRVAFPALDYCKKVMLPAVIVLMVSVPVVYLESLMADGMAMTVVATLLGVVTVALVCYVIILDSRERAFVNGKISGFLRIKRHMAQ